MRGHRTNRLIQMPRLKFNIAYGLLLGCQVDLAVWLLASCAVVPDDWAKNRRAVCKLNATFLFYVAGPRVTGLHIFCHLHTCGSVCDKLPNPLLRLSTHICVKFD